MDTCSSVILKDQRKETYKAGEVTYWLLVVSIVPVIRGVVEQIIV